MDYLRGAHNVPGKVKSACLEKFLPPWTVSRKLWTDNSALRNHSNSADSDETWL